MYAQPGPRDGQVHTVRVRGAHLPVRCPVDGSILVPLCMGAGDSPCLATGVGGFALNVLKVGTRFRT